MKFGTRYRYTPHDLPVENLNQNKRLARPLACRWFDSAPGHQPPRLVAPIRARRITTFSALNGPCRTPSPSPPVNLADFLKEGPTWLHRISPSLGSPRSLAARSRPTDNSPRG